MSNVVVQNRTSHDAISISSTQQSTISDLTEDELAIPRKKEKTLFEKFEELEKMLKEIETDDDLPPTEQQNNDSGECSAKEKQEIKNFISTLKLHPDTPNTTKQRPKSTPAPQGKHFRVGVILKKIKSKSPKTPPLETVKRSSSEEPKSQTRRHSRIYLSQPKQQSNQSVNVSLKRPKSSFPFQDSQLIHSKSKRLTVHDDSWRETIFLNNKLRRTTLSEVPDDVLFFLFTFLEPEDLGRISSVCRRWNQLAALDPLWENLSNFYYPKETKYSIEIREKKGGKRSIFGNLHWRFARSKDIPFYKNIFVKAYQSDLELLKTGLWRNMKWRPKKSPWSKEDYIYVHKAINNSSYSSSIPIKVVVVGDGAVGKTSLLIRYVKKEFPNDYIPTVFDNYSAKAVFQNEEFSVSLWDTAGPEDYDRLRPLSYIGTDIFLLCFDLVNHVSLQNSSERWIKELSLHAPNVPILLCGTKMDLRRNKKYFEMHREIRMTGNYSKYASSRPVTYDMGVEAAKKIGAVAYTETSALTGEGVERVFQEVMRSGCLFFKAQQKFRKNFCGVM